MRCLLGEMDRLGALFNRPAGLVCTRCAHRPVRTTVIAREAAADGAAKGGGA